jgi:hypothetical protein
MEGRTVVRMEGGAVVRMGRTVVRMEGRTVVRMGRQKLF